MSKSIIIDQLKTISYPGYKKNLVDFGMLQDIEESGEGYIIHLLIISDDNEKLSKVRNDVVSTLTQAGIKIKDVIIHNSSRRVEPVKTEGGKSTNPMDNKEKFEFADHVIAVSSAKGGVGKSTVAANLALGLSQKGFKTGILDLDVYGPSIPMIFDVTEQPMVQDEHTIYPAMKYGVEIMSFGFFIDADSPVIWRGPLVMKLVDQFLTDVKWSKLDYLILDLPPGTGDVQLTLSQKIFMTGAVIVTTPQNLALADVVRGVNMFKKTDVPILGLVENMSYFVCNNCGEKHHIFSTGGGERESRRLDMPLLGQLPLSEVIMRQSDTGEPIVQAQPDSEEAKAFMGIVENVVKLTRG